MASMGVRLTWRDCSGELSTQKDSRKKRTANRICVTNATGYYLRVLSRSSLNITVFWSFTKISAYTRGRWSLGENASKHNYCHACQTRFAVFFLLPSHCVSSPLPSDDMPNGVTKFECSPLLQVVSLFALDSVLGTLVKENYDCF